MAAIKYQSGAKEAEGVQCFSSRYHCYGDYVDPCPVCQARPVTSKEMGQGLGHLFFSTVIMLAHQLWVIDAKSDSVIAFRIFSLVTVRNSGKKTMYWCFIPKKLNASITSASEHGEVLCKQRRISIGT